MFNSKKKKQEQQQQQELQRQAAAEAAALREQLQALVARNGELERRLADLDQRVDQRIDERIDAQDQRISEALTSPTPTVVSPFPPPPLVSAVGVDTDLNERIETLRDQLAALTDQTAGIDARVTSISTELTNQLVELSSDIDALNRTEGQPDTSAGDSAGSTVDTDALEARIAERLDVAIDDVLDATERLAAEQARYQITFRADLAELADRLRRPGAS